METNEMRGGRGLATTGTCWESRHVKGEGALPSKGIPGVLVAKSLWLSTNGHGGHGDGAGQQAPGQLFYGSLVLPRSPPRAADAHGPSSFW